MNQTEFVVKDAKKVFRKKGACSHTLFYLLNREFGQNNAIHERAADPLAGGILQQGYQCGMLWGATMAVGAESFRRHEDLGQAITTAITTTQNVMQSYTDRTNAIDCADVTACDFNSKLSMAKFMLTGKFLSCFTLVENWAPEAMQVAYDGLSSDEAVKHPESISCASEVARKMGATDEEIATVAGFAGGLGLSGHACGALAAAIWLKTVALCQETPGKVAMFNDEAKKTQDEFFNLTDYKILCSDISERQFNSAAEHTEFIHNGGCSDLINHLAAA
ncbi:C-GCAxxG-C-C family (seleno)protein [Calditrichota bacterium]